MRTRKLTLSVDEDVIERAHRYSRKHNTSISRLVTNFLSGLPPEDREQVLAPTVRRLLGILPADVDVQDYYRHLENKYGR